MRTRAAGRGGRAVVGLLAGLLLGGGAVWGYVWYKSRLTGDAVADVSLEQADELDQVPGDAMLFAHARVADLWKAEAFDDFRKVVERAGADNLKAFDDGFAPAPSTVRRVTVFVMKDETPRVKSQPPGPLDLDTGRGVALVALSAPLDAEKYRKANLPGAVKKAAGGKDYWLDPKTSSAAHFPTDRLLVVGSGPAVRLFLTKPAKPDGPLAGAVKLAAGGTRHVVVAVNAAHFPGLADMKKGLSPDVAPVLKAEAVTFGLVVRKGGRVEARAAYKDDADAAEAERAVKRAADAAKKELWEAQAKAADLVKGKVGQPKPRPATDLPEACGGLFLLGMMGTVEEWLADPQVKREGADLTVSATVPSVNTAAAFAGFVTLLGSAQPKPDAQFRFVGESIKPAPPKPPAPADVP